jgi:hypothetical protein
MHRHRVILLFALLAMLGGTWGNVQAGSVSLSWTAPGDDGMLGQATKYEIRYALTAITEAGWGLAAVAGWVPVPALAGVRQSAMISNLLDGQRYYFAIKARDEVGNWSGISNVVSATALLDFCTGITGNVNCDPADQVNLTDVTFLVDHLFTTFRPLGCPLEANVNGDSQGTINLNDLTYLVGFLFNGGPQPSVCQ